MITDDSGTHAAASARQPRAADRRLRLLAGVGADGGRGMGHRRGAGDRLAARPARVELRDARSRRSWPDSTPPGALAIANRWSAGVPGCSPAARRASSAPRIASSAPRWRACWWRWGSRRRPRGRRGSTSPTRRCSRWPPRASSCPSSRRWRGIAFSWAEAITSAAVRLVPLGESSGQRMLAAAGAAIPEVVAHALTLPDGELGAAAPGQAIASARHETLYSRLFRS